MRSRIDIDCAMYTCFANKNYECTILKETDFWDETCPFYKHREEVGERSEEHDI